MLHVFLELPFFPRDAVALIQHFHDLRQAANGMIYNIPLIHYRGLVVEPPLSKI